MIKRGSEDRESNITGANGGSRAVTNCLGRQVAGVAL